jgi:uncharacterized repeat protein (TIGR01451 family)
MNARLRSLGLAAASAVTVFFVCLRYTQMAASQVETDNVVISEVAWAGTVHSPSDEWIELYNAGVTTVDLDGWTLADSSADISILLQGSIAPGDFYLLERTADDTVDDIPADRIYTGALNNGGESLELRDQNGTVVDTANVVGGSWPAGEASPAYRSMERISPSAPDDDSGWISNDGLTVNGTDAGGNPIIGTPRAANAAWLSAPGDVADLVVTLAAPETATAGAQIQYFLQLSNDGAVQAADVVLTATLPAGVQYAFDDSGTTPDLSNPSEPVWRVGVLDPDSALAFTLTANVSDTISGIVHAILRATSSSAEEQYANNQAQADTAILAAGSVHIVINAVLYDGYELNDADEAVQLRNVGAIDVSIGGWRLSDGSGQAILDNGLIAAGETMWLARDANAFARQFGFAPDAVVAPWPGFANDGDEVLLHSADGALVDALVYEDGDVSIVGWAGPAVWPYRVSGLFGEEGQLLFRRQEETIGLPVPDTDRADDWAQMQADPLHGRKVQYPGWSLDRFFQPAVVTARGTFTIAVAPDSAYEAFVRQIANAGTSIQIEALTMENVAIGHALQAAAERGVSVTVLLEGAPAGGIDDQQRYICQFLEEAGASCWFMIRDDALRIHDRYRYLQIHDRGRRTGRD